MGFPKSVCTSINNVIAHGIPDDRPLQDGDMINVDVTVSYSFKKKPPHNLIFNLGLFKWLPRRYISYIYGGQCRRKRHSIDRVYKRNFGEIHCHLWSWRTK